MGVEPTIEGSTPTHTVFVANPADQALVEVVFADLVESVP